jgi:hypothetical protein
MLNLGFALLLVVAQLSAPGNNLPQILTANFSSAAPVKAGVKGSVTVSFNVLKGYAVNRMPPVSLKLNPASGIRLDKTEFTTPSEDLKSKDEYYVNVPSLKVPVTAAKAGRYEIPGKLTYFFCSKSDGFCSKQAFDVRIPLQVQ